MKNKILYVTYMGLTEPLVQSQALAYLKGLSKRNNYIHILSFEKMEFISEGCIAAIRKDLRETNIYWSFLKYHKGPPVFAKIYDLFIGFVFAFYITLTKGIEILHIRGSMPAFFTFPVSKILGRRFIFDMRGLMAKEYVDGEIWKKGGFYYRICDSLERIMLRYANSIIVLTERIKHIIGSKVYTGIDITKKISVIPTAVDTALFSMQGSLSDKVRKRMNLGERFVFLYVGSLGTWYMLREMTDFIKINKYNFADPFFLIVTQSNTEKARVLLQKLSFKERDYAIIRSDYKHVPEYINSADAGMMFIKPCFSKEASCPTKFAEYLACGIPVVLNSGIGDCDRIARDFRVGVLVDSFKEDRYLYYGTELKKMKEERNGLQERCRNVAIKGFSLDSAIDTYDRIYKSQ